MTTLRDTDFVLLTLLSVALAASQASALYMPDPRRSSYEVPDILKLPDRIALDMRFRPLDIEAESEVYPTIVPGFRGHASTNAEPKATPPDAFTKSLGLAPGKALYWRIPLPASERWVAVEYDRDRPATLYVDLDRDGKLADGEGVVPFDTTTHFTVPPFRRKREGWVDFDIKLSLEATHRPDREVDPTVCWFSFRRLGRGYARRIPKSGPPGWTMRDGVPDDPFSRAVDVGDRTPIYSKIQVKDQEQWSVVSFEDGIAQTLFFDVDADGRLAKSEAYAHEFHEARFVLPTFTFPSPKCARHPYRLVVYVKGRQTPACCPGGVWEGPIKLEEKTYRLILFDTDLNGSFSDLGQDSYTFFSGKGPIPILDEVIGFGSTLSIPTHTLRQPTQISGVNIFNMQPLDISADDPETGTVVLTRDTTAWGALSVALGRRADTVFTAGKLNVGKSDRRDIHFLLDLAAPDPHMMPAWTYSIRYSQLSYKGKTGDTWKTDCRGGDFTISPVKTHTLNLGEFTLHVRSKDLPEDRQTPTITRGSELELTREITGPLGEVYTRFRNETQKKWIGSTLRVLDPAGKELVVESLGYG